MSVDARKLLAGLRFSGDVGPWTCYTDSRLQLVVFDRAPPHKPPSPAQLHQRARFGAAVRNYLASPPSVRDAWEVVVRRLGLPLTGQNLWIALSFAQDAGALDTLVAQSLVTLVMPPPV
jgi:hypothetical protein